MLHLTPTLTGLAGCGLVLGLWCLHAWWTGTTPPGDCVCGSALVGWAGTLLGVALVWLVGRR